MEPTERERTDLSSVNITLNSEEAVVASTHFSEGIGDKVWLWKVVGMTENVGEGNGIGGEQTVAVDEATVGEGVTILVCPVVKDVVVLLVEELREISDEKGGRRGRRQETERGAETGYDEKEEWPDEIVDEKGDEEERAGEDIK
jgi:hypothetical protein